MKTTVLPQTTKRTIKVIALIFSLVTSFNLTAQTEFCKVPWIPPVYDVTETHWDEPQSFWQNGGHVPENTVDDDTTNYARAHIKATGSATLRITDSTTVYPGGMLVGYYAKSRTFRDANFDGVTISTYLNGIMQESYTGDELWVEYIPEFVNDPICIGFTTTQSWNEIEIHFSDAVRVHYDVFYAVLVEPCTEELPPGLPITWLSFEVQKKGEASDLKWTTAQEFNNAGFLVERSADGRYFEPIASISASQESRDINSYAYLDMNPLMGLNYYRIRQIDIDGRVSFSTIRNVNFSTDDAEVKTWPNPARENIHVELPDINGMGEIRLVNASGIVVLSQKYEPTDRESTLNLNGVDAGFYILIIESGINRYLKTVVVLN